MKQFKKATLLIASTAAFICATSLSVAGESDAANGKKLYHQGCTGCHNTEIHTRPNKIIFSKKALFKRIKFCDSMAGNHFNDQQVSDIAEYLNQNFYKFDD